MRYEQMRISDLLEKYPFASSYFEVNKLSVRGFEDSSFSEFLERIPEAELEEWAMSPEKLIEDLTQYIDQMSVFLGLNENEVNSITILPGFNKLGEKENFERLTIEKSEIVSIVGPTGSGKSRLLADIEWAANKDTPTGRSVQINGELLDPSKRFSTSNKRVAQLSQNMNFVMDLTVEEFLTLHAESRMVENVEEMILKILNAANELAGEKFQLSTPVTGLSGGQSRALMIADTAILSKSPIVLIDEIENAGIDRKKALKLLVSEEKIVLMATHDPSLALMADKRVVIKNGGIHQIIETNNEEKSLLVELDQMDRVIQEMRNRLRNGETLTKIYKEGEI